jgi:hypothetical protein
MDRKIYFGFCPLEFQPPFNGGAWRAYSDILMGDMSRLESNPPTKDYKVYSVPEEHYDKVLKRLQNLGFELDKKSPEERKNIEFPDISTLISDELLS